MILKLFKILRFLKLAMKMNNVTTDLSTLYAFRKHLKKLMCKSDYSRNLTGATSQITFTCSKSTTETLEKGVKYL